jgi:hypothetical protein
VLEGEKEERSRWKEIKRGRDRGREWLKKEI